MRYAVLVYVGIFEYLRLINMRLVKGLGKELAAVVAGLFVTVAAWQVFEPSSNHKDLSDQEVSDITQEYQGIIEANQKTDKGRVISYFSLNKKNEVITNALIRDDRVDYKLYRSLKTNINKAFSPSSPFLSEKIKLPEVSIIITSRFLEECRDDNKRHLKEKNYDTMVERCMGAKASIQCLESLAVGGLVWAMCPSLIGALAARRSGKKDRGLNKAKKPKTPASPSV